MEAADLIEDRGDLGALLHRLEGGLGVRFLCKN